MGFDGLKKGQALIVLSDLNPANNNGETVAIKYSEAEYGEYTGRTDADLEEKLNELRAKAKEHGCVLEERDERAMGKLTEWMG